LLARFIFKVHYPFENKKEFEDAFPADFIAEGTDQVLSLSLEYLIK